MPNQNSQPVRLKIGKNEVRQIPSSGTIKTFKNISVAEAESGVQSVLNSWTDQFSYRAEDPDNGRAGLRVPQIGALHSILGHWSVRPELPGTVVMPTGTGKTETMLALLANQRIPRLLVIVPTSALRDQIGDKFQTLGILRPAGVITDICLNPFVGKVKHSFASALEAKTFFRSCNVVVTTMQAINSCDWDIRRAIADQCSHLVIDEAHHVSAPSWESFRHHFEGKPILQFTATPFRNDGKQVGGKIIYNYPLGKAQKENYFKPINFSPVYSLMEPDHAIARAAATQLEKDLAAGYDHITMVRVADIESAEKIHSIYQEVCPQFAPVVIHSRLVSREQKLALEAVKSRSSRVIVCVDMLGEGFDLPQLKIAAIHDIHKSLAITLQFIGRFTRVTGSSPVGDATVIVNRANVDVNKKLRALYAEDADWNQVIRELGQDAAGNEELRSDFNQDFAILPKEVAIQTIQPKMSTVAYRVETDSWNPDGIYNVFSEESLYTKTVAVSEKHKIVWFVTQEQSEVRWGQAKDIENVVYHLYVIHWWEEGKLLFINSSNNDSVHEGIAKSVAGDSAEIIKGTDVYRAMHGISRVVPTNMGLIDLLSQSRRFMMLVGADVTEGLDPTHTFTKTKTNIFGVGYEAGDRVAIGCALKGRIWSHSVAHDISKWVVWCHGIGIKLRDDTINIDEVFKGFIKPVRVDARPPLVPLAIEWPLEFLSQQEDKVEIKIGTESAPFYDASIELKKYEKDGPIWFVISVGAETVEYQMSFGNDGTKYLPRSAEAYAKIGKRSRPISEWFRQYGPKVHFEMDTYMEQDLLLHVDRPITPFDPERIEAWDWTGVNFRKESQGPEKIVDSVQRRVITGLLSDGSDWDIIFDDDDSREIADVVAIKMSNGVLKVHLFHCKYSLESNPGSRVDELYAVCGQAQKSAYWRSAVGYEQIVHHMLKREQTRLESGLSTRFEKGNMALLEEIAIRQGVLKPEFKVHIVQPGLSKQRATKEVSELLAATSLYLHETFNIEFSIIGSP